MWLSGCGIVAGVAGCPAIFVWAARSIRELRVEARSLPWREVFSLA
jgi:hypothetical protein